MGTPSPPHKLTSSSEQFRTLQVVKRAATGDGHGLEIHRVARTRYIADSSKNHNRIAKCLILRIKCRSACQEESRSPKSNSSWIPSASRFAARRWRLLGCGDVRISIGQPLSDHPFGCAPRRQCQAERGYCSGNQTQQGSGADAFRCNADRPHLHCSTRNLCSD